MHENHGHVEYKCTDSDGRTSTCDIYCCFCEGGLFACTVCGAGEGSLTWECPKVEVSSKDQELVYKGTLDYRDGVWCRRPFESWEEHHDLDMIDAIDEAIARLNGA